MINATQQVLDALNDLETVLYVTMTIQWPTDAGGTENLTDYHSDITIGGVTYSASGGLVNYSRPAARSIVSRNQFSVELDNNTNSRNAQIEAAQSGVTIDVFLNFEDPATGAHIGQIEIFNGVSTSAQITEARSGGHILRVDYSGQIENLTELRARFTTQSSQQAVDPLDTSMDFAHNPDGDLVLNWGRD